MPENNPLVSIIVPCYNQATYLAETLDSVLAQTYTNWECVIVNDGSPDNTEEIANHYISKDKRFCYLYQENMGLAMARNNGIRKSSGTYILPLDSDDIIADTYIEKAVRMFSQNRDVKLVYCKAKFFGKANEEWDLPYYKYENLLWDNIIFCSALYRRKDFDNTIGYNPNMKGGLEDWDFWLTLLKPTDKVCRIEEILFSYRIKDFSMSTQITNGIRQELLRQIYCNHKNAYEPYLKDIIIYRRQVLFVEHNVRIAQENVRSSKAYRLGRFLLAPFCWMKRKISKFSLK